MSAKNSASRGTVTAGMLDLKSPLGSAHYVYWAEEHRQEVSRLVLENERRIDTIFDGLLEPDELFLLKFILNHAIIHPGRDPMILAGSIPFLDEKLDELSKPGMAIRLSKEECRNSALYLLLKRLAPEKGLRLVAEEPRKRRSLFHTFLPVAIWGYCFTECLLSGIARLFRKKQRPAKRVILSNFRHYAKRDTENVFWGTLFPVFKKAGLPPPPIAYYNQLAPIDPRYYLRQLLDRKHAFLTDELHLRDLSANLKRWRRLMRQPRKQLSYIYKGVDYGDAIAPLIDSFFRLFLPLLMKNKSALRRFVKGKRQVLMDSEVNLLAMQLGYLKGKTSLVVLSNEVVRKDYGMIPLGPKRSRPGFDMKVVYGTDEQRILTSLYKYPSNKVFLFPDPRFLVQRFEQRPVEDRILLISSATYAFIEFSNRLAKRRPRRSLPLTFKVHPYETTVPKHDKAIKAMAQTMTVLDGPLTYVPKYGVTTQSTLGFELLFQGSVVFFIDDIQFGIQELFGIKKHLPFLVCTSEAEVLRKIARLEKEPKAYQTARRKIAAHLNKRYLLDGLDKRYTVLKRRLTT